MDFISDRTTQFFYFNQLLGNPVWKGRKILDFGGNCGGFLAGAGDEVNHDDYWCLDVGRAALDEGRQKFPKAHFRHYDRYSAEYNPAGSRYAAVPDLGFDFHFILAFSVFTHTNAKEMLELAGQLRRRLTPDGILAFTFADPSYDTGLLGLPSGLYLPKLLKMHHTNFPENEVEAIVESARRSKWSLLIDDQLHVEPDNELDVQESHGVAPKSYCAFYSVDYMASLFPDATILPPVGQEWQHCCVIHGPK